MSFILDALRKSEHERQRSSVPSLSHVPLAVPRRHVPAWALVLIGVLAAAVLMLGGAWWQSRQPAATAQSSPATPRVTEAPAAAPPPAVARNAPPAAAGTAPTAASVPSAPEPAAVPVAIVPPAVQDVAIVADERSDSLANAVRVAKTPAPRGPTLPSAAALLEQGISLPPLHLELHAYSDKPSERFVFINGRKYKEGDRLAEGPDVVIVEPNGVVLSQQGQRFLLAPE